ncbi:MAG: N-acetylmuramoyl-L-alanine amidase [Xanthomonadales bacterium]|nr:N-acetylmuramoyl-L-alanine amidase [Xanthomonadales bacterium]
MSQGITRRFLPYVDALEARPLEAIDLVVIHCTELPDLATARAYGERVVYPDSGTGNSGHFYVERNGRVEEWVPPDRIAHHVRGYNPRSIGIELVNRGRYPDWYHSEHQYMREPYPATQIDALATLLAALKVRLPGLRWIAGHDALDPAWVTASDDASRQVRRKLDPGPGFPWDDIVSRVTLERLPHDPTPPPAPAGAG